MLHGDSTQVETVNVFFRNARCVQECCTGLALIGIRIGDWNIALITKEDVHAGPIDGQGWVILTLLLRSGIEAS